MLAKLKTHDITVNHGKSLDQNPAAVYLASLKPNAARVQRQALNEIARMLGTAELRKDTGHRVKEDWTCLNLNWAALRFQHTAAIRAQLEIKGIAPATANRWLCALRKTLKAAWRLGQMTHEDYARAADVESVKGETLPAGRAPSAGEIAALMAACENDNTPAGARDAALIALAYAAGLRRDEIAKLDLADYDQETGLLKVLHAKRNKQRTAYLVNGSRAAMADWLELRGSEPGPLFCPINKGGKLIINMAVGWLTDQAIYNVLQKRAREAGVQDLSPHDMRRAFISDLLDIGVDISTVAKMAGHSSVTTTARYDRRGEEAKVKAAGLLHVPYHRRGHGATIYE
ncbi:MAG: site-specific integrase [Chloroflexi bacterium]|nr:site-specific integrase [Chloroflexota bacterium]